ncbi:MAG: metalloregulator ArsR/SmtB family transcription factor [Defluviitaleaceae bacterium]|nr:metalloregulator ArsR/SmtB family transcription factor [Defluviitaleaceae bacterium]
MSDEREMCCAGCINPARVAQIRKSMVRDETLYDIADFFKVLGDSTRLKILFALLGSEVCVGDLSTALGISQSSVSHQLRILRQNNVVKFRKQGKAAFYSLDDEHVEALLTEGLEHLLQKNIYEESPKCPNLP